MCGEAAPQAGCVNELMNTLNCNVICHFCQTGWVDIRLVLCTILAYRTWNVLISFRAHLIIRSLNHLHESISISYTPLLSSLNHVVVSFFPNLSTRPSTKVAGPLGISPPTAFLASSSKLGSSSNVHSSSPPYALGRFCASMRVHSVGPGSLPRTYILFRVPSSNQPCVHVR